MFTRAGAVFCATLLIATSSGPASTAPEPPLTLCDVSANVANVVRSCEEEIRANPLVARFHDNLGSAYRASRRYDDARRSFERAAELGSAGGMTGLGFLYKEGLGVPQSYVEARKWFEKAAALNDATAAFNLGVLCESGLGIPKSLAEARDWYQKAANLGSLDAKHALARLK